MVSLERDLLRIQTSVTESYQDMGNTWGSGAGRTTAIVIPREVPQAPSRGICGEMSQHESDHPIDPSIRFAHSG